MEEILKKMQVDMLDAMKVKDTDRADVLRLIISDIKTEQINTGAEVPMDKINKLILSSVKAMKEASEQYNSIGDKQAAEKELSQIKVLEQYLPKMMTSEEIEDVVEGVIAELHASGMQDMGRVMGLVMSRLQGTADGAMVQEIVKKELQDQ